MSNEKIARELPESTRIFFKVVFIRFIPVHSRTNKFMKEFLSIIFAIWLCSTSLFAQNPYIVVLGIGQDAGVPQMGCDSPFCKEAWKNLKLRQTVSSIALVNPKTKERWIFDATPDLPEQFQLLKNFTVDFSNNIAGIFLTHAHIGHYTGLMYLGRESMNTKDVKVYAMPRMKEMLEKNAPWSQLVSVKNISLQRLENKQNTKISENISVQPFLVPHRDEFSETVGFKIMVNSKSLVFIPDIDKWQKWSEKLEDVVKSSDYVLIDGTFYADGEINRPMSEVPHPFVSETVDLLKDMPLKEKNKVYFIHFNHSNPLVQGNKNKIKELKTKGFNLTFQGQKFNF
ncbi:MAG TPA: MBL fold metallo-hydrolase [Pyrinomonadaceae bacterium]|nr:MBL fold metallo-hydrolase [Pyrinomonadaceae bacterium]